MSVDVSDLIPKTFKVKLGEHEFDCFPPRMSHSLIISKMGDVIDNQSKYTAKDVQQLEADLDNVIGELIPDLKGVKLSMEHTMSVIEQMALNVEPADNKELRDNGVKFDGDPKAPTIG